MNQTNDQSQDTNEIFLLQTSDNFQFCLDGVQVLQSEDITENKKEVWKEFTRQVTNTSQIETTLNNQSISSRKVPKLPYLYTKHNQVLSTSRKLLLEENSVIIQLNGQKKELLKLIYDRQLDDAIDITKKLVQQCIAYDLNIFGKSLHILADLYISNREFANGLYIYNVLRVLADVQNNQALKIEALIQMGDLCKLQQQYHLSKIFLKKALQYVWYMNDTENEATIYDYFGVLYYVQGELRLAKEYHDRAMNFIKESNDSAARKHGIEYVKTYIKRINYQSQVMNNMVLSKLGLIQGNETEIKLNTLLDFNILTDQILQDYEFQVEMSTPNRPQRCITKNGVLQNDVDMFENVKELHERQKKRKFFEKKIPVMHLTRSVFKQTIEEQLEQRMKTDKQKNSVEEYKKQLQKFHTYKNFPEKLEKVNINHLSPNRNLIGFKYSFKPMRHSLLDLFGEIEQYMYLHQS
ncbi:unnamed protein product [Paramecium pentaurelia]|uniref:Uncharacterized protein n=1 Tax=Paramecium pentaurelia TaxID=43138 RepID=A0A8S1WA93_9CILI|nr:unnamed protein product [Paramecium pentaurelia]